MSYHISRRTGIRVVSFSLAIVAALAGTAIYQHARASQYHQVLEYNYQRSLSDLTDALSNISSTLEKEVYAGTDWQRANLSTQLWREATMAKSAMSSLPVSDFHLTSTYKFLSQVGEYAMALSKRASAGEEITQEEQENLRKLWEYSQGLSSQMSNLAQDLYNAQTPVSDLAELSDWFNEAEESQGEVPSVVSGFQEMEESFEGYPTLIYDGPFSDHIMERTPRMLENLEEVDKPTAKQRAAQLLEVSEENLQEGSEESSNMPSYTFGADGATVSITKQGGIVSYLLRSRAVTQTKLSSSDAVAKAKEFLDKLGMTSMTESYYETSNGICTVNFSYQQGDVTVYADLVKVSVALDDGQVLSMDARGYLTNHTKRELPQTRISEEEARKAVSSSLNILKVKQVIIPTSGLNEVYCYEFLTTGPEDEHILVYINAETGREEQLLILMESENGVLTK